MTAPCGVGHACAERVEAERRGTLWQAEDGTWYAVTPHRMGTLNVCPYCLSELPADLPPITDAYRGEDGG